MSIPVVAVQPGFFDKLREVGEHFDVPDGTELGSWMKRTDGSGGADPLDEPVQRLGDPFPQDDPTVGEGLGDTLDIHDVKKGRSGKK